MRPPASSVRWVTAGTDLLGRTAGSPNKERRDGAEHACLHAALDGHTHLACTEDLPAETASTRTGFLTRAKRGSPHEPSPPNVS